MRRFIMTGASCLTNGMQMMQVTGMYDVRGSLNSSVNGKSGAMLHGWKWAGKLTMTNGPARLELSVTKGRAP